MATGNERLFDAAVRHQVGVRRFATGEVRRVLKLLEEADRDLVRQLRSRLGRGVARDSITTRRLEAILEEIRGARKATMTELQKRVRGTLVGLATMEADFEARMITESMPMDLDLVAVGADRLRAVVGQVPFRGRNLGTWFSRLASVDQDRLMSAIRLGFVEGETVDQIVRRVAGTRLARFADGALSVSRRNAEAIVRTGVNHVSNAARGEVWNANADIIEGLRWTSTLDGRTSPICQARDGNIYAINEGPRPPAHVSCRSVMVAIIDGESAVGERPFVADARTGRRRQLDFRKQARREMRDEGFKGPLSSEMLTARTRKIRQRWARENVGTVPSETTYEAFLRRQPDAFQNTVLGRGKAELFRDGLRVDQFVDPSGRGLSLTSLLKAQEQNLQFIKQAGVVARAEELLTSGMDSRGVFEMLRGEFPEGDTSLKSVQSIKSRLKKRD